MPLCQRRDGIAEPVSGNRQFQEAPKSGRINIVDVLSKEHQLEVFLKILLERQLIKRMHYITKV